MKKYFCAICPLIVIAIIFSGKARAEISVTVHPLHFANDVETTTSDMEEVDNTPGNAALYDDSQWTDQRAASIKDMTDYMSGVITQPHDGNESSRLSVRGSGLANAFQGSGLLVMEDGVPINMADGEFEFPTIEPWLISRAQVFPGADAIQYGASTFGGAINFVMPNGQTSGPLDLRAEGGSYGTNHDLISTGQQWDKNDMFAGLASFTQDGFRDHNNQTSGHFSGNWGWQPNDNFSNRVYISQTHSDAEIPGAISYAKALSDPQAANSNNIAGNYQRNLDITRIADRSAWQQGPDRVDTTVFYAYRHLDNPVTTYEFQDNNDTGVMAKYTHKYGLSQWFAGFNIFYGGAAENRYQNVMAVPGSQIVSRNLYAMTNEIYSQVEQFLVGKLYAIAALQAAYDTRDIAQTYPTTQTQNNRYAGYNPKIGLRYDLNNDTQLFTNLSRSFEPPNWSSLSGGNSPGFVYLKAQHATTAEIGARGQVDALHWQAAYYHSWLSNEFVNYQFATGSTATINAKSTRKDGVELSLNGDVAHNLFTPDDAASLRLAYTFSHFTLHNDPIYGNNYLPGVPEHYIRAEAMYALPWGVSFGPNVEWSPVPQPVDLANTLKSDAYAIYGARALWKATEKLDFYVEGRNLLNKNYIATYNVIPNAHGADGNNFYPGEGRSVYAGIHWKM